MTIQIITYIPDVVVVITSIKIISKGGVGMAS